MVIRVASAGVLGVDAFLVWVEVDTARGLSQFTVVGLPEAAVRESQVRVRSAIRQSGEPFPDGRVVVNLAPADVRKGGTAYDLPLSIGLLAGRSEARAARVDEALFYGELGLDGEVRRVSGVLPVALLARELGYARIVVPAANVAEAAVVQGIAVNGVAHLRDLVAWLDGAVELAPARSTAEPAVGDSGIDLADVRGQHMAKRAIELAAAGGHNLLMHGSPGSGKTMLARRLVTILPTMSLPEQIETTKIYSVADLLPQDSGLIRQRPFRAPHHTVSDVALAGGGSFPRPGEVSLAHNGVLFLDELPEFRRQALEVLRQPLEDRQVTVARARSRVTFPASFMLVAAMNPCPCGYLKDPRHPCQCSAQAVQRYRARISGPLLDRIDLHVEVRSLPLRDLLGQQPEESSATVRARVDAARARQQHRFRGTPVRCNAEMGPREIARLCRLDGAAKALLARAVDKLGLSARAYHRILKLGRTLADLAGAEALSIEHVEEAIRYRAPDFEGDGSGQPRANGAGHSCGPGGGGVDPGGSRGGSCGVVGAREGPLLPAAT